MSQVRFEIVHGDDKAQPYHCRIKAANGRNWFVQETVQRRRSALAAGVNLTVALVDPDRYELVDTGLILTKGADTWTVQIHDVDERTP